MKQGGATTTRLLNPHSFHPTLSVSIPPLIRSTHPDAHQTRCEPHLLVHLPSGVFYDPFTAGSDIIGKKRDGRGAKLLADHVELEHAVGWTSRPSRNPKLAQRGWWETIEAEQPPAHGSAMVFEDTLQAAIRSKAEQVIGQQNPPPGIAARWRAQIEDKKASEPYSQEVSSILVPIHLDQYLAADGLDDVQSKRFSIDIPLHVRYQPPSTPVPTAGLPSLASSFVSLLQDILPITTAARIYHYTLHRLFGRPLPPSLPSADGRDRFVEVQLLDPLVYLGCPPPRSYRSPPSGARDYESPIDLFPLSHAHLKKHLANHSASKHALYTYTTDANSTSHTLQIKVPLPEATLLAPVQITTVATVLSAALVVVYHLLANVLPLLEKVEKLA